MSGMFYKCSSLKELNLSNFNTNKVTDMSYMFCECSSLTKLNLCNFTEYKVINVKHMFANCFSLADLKLYNFDLEKIDNYNSKELFHNCPARLKRNIQTKGKYNNDYIYYFCSLFK